jgi:hypothetical protein
MQQVNINKEQANIDHVGSADTSALRLTLLTSTRGDQLIQACFASNP